VARIISEMDRDIGAASMHILEANNMIQVDDMP